MLTLSVVIPAHNEEGSIRTTVENVFFTLSAMNIPHEIVVVNDHSTDTTASVTTDLMKWVPTLRIVENNRPNGFGNVIQTGLENFGGDAVCLLMADGSDDPRDLVEYYRKLEEGYECVFGSRFIKGGRTVDYPKHKLILNRVANWFIRCLFGFRYNDTTNAFKCYRRQVIEGVAPVFACHFNITVELPLKAITRGYSYAIVPTTWYNRTSGVSKLKIKEMGSRYLFIVLYVFLESLLSRGDYRRSEADVSGALVSAADVSAG